MAEYTYKDIIIDPTSEEAKNAISKEVYFADTPASCLNAAKNNNKAYLGYLKELDLGDEEQPFYINEFVSAPSSWTCIIVKKEEPKPKYEPFETLDEFIESYKKAEERIDCSNIEGYIVSCGMWLKDTDRDVYCLVTEIWNYGVVVGDSRINTIKDGDEYYTINEVTKWETLLREYTFLDGTPCGKLMEESNA